MATNPNNPNPQQPLAQPTQQPVQQPQQQQPQPPANMGEMTPQQVRSIADNIQPTLQQPVQQPQQQPVPQIPGLPPIERGADGMLSMKLPTGQVYKGRDMNELTAALAQAQVNASQRITELGSETARLRQGIAAVTGQPVQGPDGQPAAQVSQFDRATYMELQALDPILAANYLDAHRLGLPSVNDVVPTYQSVMRATQEFQTAQTVNQFRVLAPDFPGTQEAVNLVMDFMRDQKIPFTAQNLKLVHDGMVRAGKYQPLAPQQFMPVAQPTVTAMPTMQPQAQPQAPAMYDPSPQGNYAFGPNGFGSQYETPAATPPAPAMPAAPQLPVQQTVAYPAMPQQAMPMPMPQVTTQPTAPTGGNTPITEEAVNTMGTAQLRQLIENNLPR